MLFNSYEFILLFLPITVFIFYVFTRIGTRLQTLGFLATASLFFYGWWNPSYLVLICASLITNFVIGAALQKEEAKWYKKRTLLLIGIVFNLGFLGYYKYGGFVVDIYNTLNNQNVYWEYVILPLAISFFTFQQIVYLIDSSAGRVKKSNFVEYTVFVTFFPQLIAGPIVHHKEMMPQFKSLSLCITKENLQIGLILFAIGLFKKTMLADSIADYVSPIYAEASYGSITFLQAWIAGLGFTLQVYFDFSGYSDMALGAARMFGIVLPVNFNSPLKSPNIIGYWSRFHITLTRLLTDYVFTPIAISATRKSVKRNITNKVIRKASDFVTTLAVPTVFTMFLSGVWHGAGYQFIIFGCIHGFYLVINHTWRALLPIFISDKKKYERLFYPVGLLLTLVSVCLAMFFFRADSADTAYNMALTMIGFNGISLPEGVFVQLGSLKEILVNIGIGIDATAGSSIVFGGIYCVVLLVIALVFPNSLDIVKNYSPALGYKEKSNKKAGLLFDNHLTKSLVWKPNKVWAVSTGIVLAIGIMSLQALSVFLYWQF